MSRIDSQMVRTVEMLAEKPLEYEYRNPINAIERALRLGLATASNPHEKFINGKWRTVRTVTVPNGDRNNQ